MVKTVTTIQVNVAKAKNAISNATDHSMVAFLSI